MFEKKHSGKILPAAHHKSIQMELILRDIVQALHSGLRLEHECSGRYASKMTEMFEDRSQGTLMALSFGEKGELKGKSHGEDETDCQKGVQRHRKRLIKFGTKHLHRLNWEVIVIDYFERNAHCFPSGKIVVFTGLLNDLKSDAEIATVIGHEVGHAVARHASENLVKCPWMIILLFINAHLGNAVIQIFRKLALLRLSQRMEAEADYIGLMLMASAGYDPQEAPKVYELRLGCWQSEEERFLATHPSGRKRANMLNEAKVMEEALAVYKDVRAGRGVRSFI